MARVEINWRAAAAMRAMGQKWKVIGRVLAEEDGRRTAYTEQAVIRAVQRKKDRPST